MSDWSLEPMDITKHWLLLFSDALSAIFACLTVFLSWASENHAWLGWELVIDSAIAQYSTWL